MRMKLFLVTIEMADDRHPVTIVAPHAEGLMELVRAHLAEVGGTFVELSVMRIDNTLSGDARLGLDQLLDTGLVGFTSFAEGLGWVQHIAPVHRLKLYRIEAQDGSQAHVVAPNKDIAAAVWAQSRGLSGDEPIHFRFADGMADLNDEQRDGIRALLDFGSIGVATWTDDGWSVGD